MFDAEELVEEGYDLETLAGAPKKAQIALPQRCPDCGSDDIEHGRTARKRKLIAHCRHCKGWYGKKTP